MDISTLIVILGVLVFVVNVIVEVTKNLYPLSEIKTNYYVVALSLLLTFVSYFCYVSYMSISVMFYHIVAVFIFAFIVAYLAMFGWEKLIKLWQDSKGE